MGLVLLGSIAVWCAAVRAADAAAETAVDTGTNTTAGADAGTAAEAQPEPNAKSAPGAERAASGTSEDADAQPELRPWPTGLAGARRCALAEGKPILVRAGAEWCPACRALADEIAKPEVQDALAGWTLVYVDVEDSPDEARRLAITATPTLKVLTPGGRPVAGHVGTLSAEELAAWLNERAEAARAAPDLMLLGTDRPSMLTVVKLLGALGDRDPAVRRAAIGRLLMCPDIAGGAVLKTLREGTLAQRLSALELFETWNAPIEGLDPWQPESIDAERLARLEAWLDRLEEPAAAPAEEQPPAKLSDEQLAEARLEIQRMLRADETGAAAIRQRLTRFGPALAEQVDRLLAEPADDRQLERLRALRYRLAATDSLVLRWPGGLERLAATDTAERRDAAGQLVELAEPPDQALLLLLYADADPLVRELSLRGLQRIGGAQSTEVLAGLLADPEPNVRAAVLKLLEENPQPAMVPKVAEYLKTEKDPDLIVHAVRFLRAAGGATAVRAMMELVEHESWQVRAEAAAGLGNVEMPFRVSGGVGSFISVPRAANEDEQLRAETYAVLIRLLEDPDAFVVSRAVEGLSGADLAVAVEPLVEAAARHPELAVPIVDILARGEQMRPKAVSHLRRFAAHEEPKIRAAAIHGLVLAVPASMEEELAAALADEVSEVRIAGAAALMVLFERAAQNARQEIEARQEQRLYPSSPLFVPSVEYVPPEPSGVEVLGEALRSLFGSGGEEQAPGSAPSAGPSTGPSTAPPAAPSTGTPEVEPVPGYVEPAPEYDEGEEITPPEATREDRSGAPPADENMNAPEVSPDGTARKAEAVEALEPRVLLPGAAVPLPEGPVPLPGVAGQLSEAPGVRPEGGDSAGDEAAAIAELTNPGLEWDRWLEGFYQGKGRPQWVDAMVEPLRKMLAAEDARERMVAAVALVPLGRVDEALPVVLETVRGEPTLSAEASEVLPWLVWERRLEMFHKLRPLTKDDAWQLVENLAPVADQRAAEVMWDLLESEEEGQRLAGPLEYTLRRVYGGTRYGSLDELNFNIRREVLRAVRPHAEEGAFWQATLALLLMLQAAPDEAVSLAKSLAEDPSVEKRLRQAAFQIYLAGSAPEERRKVAIESLNQKDSFRVRLAVGYLALGERRLATLEIEGTDVSLSVPIEHDGTYDPFGRPNSSGPIIPQAPPGLKAGHVRPLVDHEDPVVAAQAGYLLALLGDEQGLGPLLRLWRQGDAARQEVGDLDRLVYRAIAILNDTSQIDVLRTIRKSLSEYEISEFYWTIRIMGGPEVLELRKEIREEVGLERLR